MKYAITTITVVGPVTAQYNQKEGLGNGNFDGVEKSSTGVAKKPCDRDQ
jgi:hypothetical protein